MEKLKSKRLMGHVFVSYSRADVSFAQNLVENLEQHRCRTWIDYRDLDLRKPLIDQLTLAVRNADVFILVNSQYSRLSEWVNFELTLARLYQKAIYVIYVSSVGSPSGIIQAPDSGIFVSCPARKLNNIYSTNLSVSLRRVAWPCYPHPANH